jgi:hypothetical protein
MICEQRFALDPTRIRFPHFRIMPCSRRRRGRSLEADQRIDFRMAYLAPLDEGSLSNTAVQPVRWRMRISRLAFAERPIAALCDNQATAAGSRF